jgi:hypothetical protein
MPFPVHEFLPHRNPLPTMRAGEAQTGSRQEQQETKPSPESGEGGKAMTYQLRRLARDGHLVSLDGRTVTTPQRFITTPVDWMGENGSYIDGLWYWFLLVPRGGRLEIE